VSEGAPEKLSANSVRRRVVALAWLTLLLIAAKFGSPSSFASWMPFSVSCGAVTGLPCVFCGGTRAIHYLLNGEVRRALYFNWLAFPAVGVATGSALLLLAEISLRRKLWKAPFAMTPARFSAGLMALALLWPLQIYLAVSQHKTELLNPHGALYGWFVR
jgi:hypothetical protein